MFVWRLHREQNVIWRLGPMDNYQVGQLEGTSEVFCLFVFAGYNVCSLYSNNVKLNLRKVDCKYTKSHSKQIANQI